MKKDFAINDWNININQPNDITSPGMMINKSEFELDDPIIQVFENHDGLYLLDNSIKTSIALLENGDILISAKGEPFLGRIIIK